MDNIAFVDEENIPMVHQNEEDYDDYNTPGRSRVETSFIKYDATEPTSTLRLKTKVKRDKTTALCRYLDVMGDIDLIDLDQFRLTKDKKKGVTIFEFYNGDRWVPLTKQTGGFFASKTLRDELDGLNAMKKCLGIDKTPPVLQRSLRATTKLKGELLTDLMMESIPLKDLSSLAKEIHVKTREASQNTDLNMRELFGIDKALQSIQGELLNSTTKLKEINARIERDTKKLEEVKDNPTYSNEQK